MATSSAAFLIVLIALPFGGSCLAALFPANARNAEAYLAGGVALTALALVIVLYSQVANGGIVQYRAPWVPELGLEFNLRMDGFAWLLAALVTGIGFLVVLYARYYMSPADPVPRFYSFLLAFMGAMLGIVLSGNLIQLVFFWELTSLFSFLLIGYWHQIAQARDMVREDSDRLGFEVEGAARLDAESQHVISSAAMTSTKCLQPAPRSARTHSTSLRSSSFFSAP